MSGLPNVQQNNEQILNDIQSLQQIEQQLFSNLESNPNLTTEQQQSIIEKMNQISNMRINLYQTLSGVNNYYQSALNSSVGTLQEQTLAIGIVESELNTSKERLNRLEQEKNNKIRLVEINTYFGDKYTEHSQLMKIIIFALIPIIIISFLYTKGILPKMVYLILIVIISLICAFFFWKKFASIIMRDNMNYQEYAYPFDPSNITTSTTTSSSDPWQSSLTLGSCVGDSCCSTGLTYDASLNQCVVGSSTGSSTSSSTGSSSFYSGLQSMTETFVTESMVNNILTKQQFDKYKSDYNMKSPYPSNA
jgi:membrane-associated HD superfamily phosphohydrolase